MIEFDGQAPRAYVERHGVGYLSELVDVEPRRTVGEVLERFAVLLAAAILGSVVPVASVLATGVAAYVLTAGVTFLLSTLVRFDAPIAALWLLAGFPVYGAARLDLHPSAGTYAPARTLVLLVVVLYGLIAYAGGGAVLRRRAVST